jgi:GTP diphosphokinase
VKAFNTRTSKQDIATMDVTFEIGSAEEIRALQDKLRQCEGIIDIERS